MKKKKTQPTKKYIYFFVSLQQINIKILMNAMQEKKNKSEIFIFGLHNKKKNVD